MSEDVGAVAPNPPLLRIVNPDATPEEVAAIVAVLSALGGGEAPTPRRRPEWNAPHRMVRPAVSHGPGGWRASSLPR
ncbi:hypothetical protein BH11ACT8_BH11ACT8_17070 [soil metagenome]